MPFLDDASLGKKRSNIWACNADFVALAAGDHEEHAHLLAGFFMELGQEVGCCSQAQAGTARTHQLYSGDPYLASGPHKIVLCSACCVEEFQARLHHVDL